MFCNTQKIIYLCSVIKETRVLTLKRPTVDEKEKLKVQLALIDNTLNTERRKQLILGVYNEERFNKLLDKRNRVKEKIEKLNNK